MTTTKSPFEDLTQPSFDVDDDEVPDASDAPTSIWKRHTASGSALGDFGSDRTAEIKPVAISLDEIELTSPGLMPVPFTGADALHEKRGDIAQLLSSLAPFLWSLEGAEKFLRERMVGDAEAEGYARSLALLARVLSQLQARIDEVKASVPR